MPTSGTDPIGASSTSHETPPQGRIIVSDAGPLISLGRLDLLGLLGELFAEVQVPDIVLEECLARPANVDAERI